MAYLTYLGATGGSPTEIDMKVAPQYEAGKQVVAGSGCLACHKLGENGNNGPGPGTDPHRRPHPARGDRALARDRPGHHALLPRPAAEEAQRARGLPRLAEVAPSRRGREAHAIAEVTSPNDGPGRTRRRTRSIDRRPTRRVRRPGRTDVRPDRGRLRPDELGDDRRHAPPLARAGRRPRRASGPATPPSTSAAAPATWPSSWPGASAPTAASSAATSPSRCSTWRGEKAAERGASQASLRVGRRARAALRRRRASTRSRSASGSATSPTSTAGCAEMARVLKPGGRARDPRDHPAAPAAALDLLLALVRPDRAAARRPRRRPRRLLPTCPSRCKRFPAPAGLAEMMAAAGLRADPLHGAGRRDHRDPLGRQAAEPGA